MIEELLYNLCSNAIRYNKPNGRVDVLVTETEEGITFVTECVGKVFAPEEFDKIRPILEQMYRNLTEKETEE